MKIVGLERKTGDFEGTKYDNVTFHCVEPYEEGKGIGSRTKSYKVKWKVLIENFGKELTERELTALVGQTAEFYFNEYKAVTLVDIQTPQK